MKKILLLSLCLCVATISFSQTPDPFPTWGQDLVKFLAALVVWIFNNWDDALGLFTAVLIALQAFLRIIPTKDNWDFLTVWIEWLQERIPNRTSDGGVFRTTTQKEIDK
jgi:hypothetical protein